MRTIAQVCCKIRHIVIGIVGLEYMLPWRVCLYFKQIQSIIRAEWELFSFTQLSVLKLKSLLEICLLFFVDCILWWTSKFPFFYYGVKNPLSNCEVRWTCQLNKTVVPVTRKVAVVRPISKNGDKTDKHNYRPINILFKPVV